MYMAYFFVPCLCLAQMKCPPPVSIDTHSSPPEDYFGTAKKLIWPPNPVVLVSLLMPHATFPLPALKHTSVA